ncbi:SusC/RagA family TonB-linked outer membrane protein [Flavitalea sp. BT771]|uniref:SusC/RagA family TonB-linked outer membrane protein n=1 Tax=Flavitalea sp. BT771 TaxID=3063329 RepID=UPI0026E3298F|nr:SusC/RagA family TonB-linked outer membrane protein [Flavitalea sp. BT771]MDO6433879.1 SusC/RagA family TonB-linked outer membrane protein [Flavitalea sp. BT771]MDV6222216.1 SusC/RagA family TonB-linked outer membrane protein [Flavitalea sp. BT771]
MKLTTFFLVAIYLHLGATGFGQKVTISGKDLPLEKVFTMIKKQTGYVFFYDYSIFQGVKNVTLDFKNANIENVIEECLQGQGLDYSILNKTIFITRKPERKIVLNDPIAEKMFKTKGVVYNESGQPLSGANITIKQTGKGTLTNAKGEFVLPAVPENSILIISYVGYKSHTFIVKNEEPISIRLTIAMNDLDVQVVQAYGRTSKRLTTSNIGRVTSEEIERQPIMNPLLALQGKVAGLDVVQTSGFASAPVKIELRGRSAINSLFTSDPLYIIDGVPLTVLEVGNSSTYESGSYGFLQSGYGGPANGQSPFFSLNPGDIESIEVLKDADATAIYGSRGANGVILISTKKGKTGKTKLDMRIESGLSKVTKYWQMMNTQQYLQMRKEALKNDGITPSINHGDYDLLQFDTTKYTDWQKSLYGGTGRNIDAYAGLSGGDVRTTFRLGASYNRNTNIQTVSGADQRGSLSFNLTHRSANQRFSVGLIGQYSYTQSDMINIAAAGTLPPNAPAIYDSVGNLNYAGYGGSNATARQRYPFYSLKQPYTAKTNFLNSNLVFGYLLFKGLQFTTNLGYNNTQANTMFLSPIASQDPLSSPVGLNRSGYNTNKNWIVEPQISYDGIIGEGKLSILAGASVQHTSTGGILLTGDGYTDDRLLKSIANAQTQRANDLFGEYKYAAAFGRVTYNLKNKYILNFNGRRDGSSRFGEGNQYGNFGSVGAAWIFSEENWLKKGLPFISFGKLRGSYGTTGSDAVGDYQYLTRWSANVTSGIPYNGSQPLFPTQHANPNYRWQVNKKLEAALNLGFLKDRINLEAVYYRDRCGNQLVSFPTPYLSGFTSVIANSPALVQNAGWEFTMGAKLIDKKDLTWTINFNISLNKNKLLAYPNIDQSPYASLLIIGKSLNMINLFHNKGVDPQTGEYIFEDKNHDGEIVYDPAHPDQTDTYAFDRSPKYFGGIGMNFNYKGFALNLFFQYKKQIGKNAFANSGLAGKLGNQSLELFEKHWQKPGDIASYAKFTTKTTDSYIHFIASDGIYTDASFVRLSNLSLSYTLPSSIVRKAGMEGCTFFIHTNNLFVITKYKGLDPDTQVFGSMPPSKTLVGGITFNF